MRCCDWSSDVCSSDPQVVLRTIREISGQQRVVGAVEVITQQISGRDGLDGLIGEKIDGKRWQSIQAGENVYTQRQPEQPERECSCLRSHPGSQPRPSTRARNWQSGIAKDQRLTANQPAIRGACFDLNFKLS